jgi:hypothetical protein
MLKMLRNRLGEYNKSCSTFHQESNKIWFGFSQFFCDFLGNLQDPAKSVTLFKKQLTSRPLELLIPHKGAPGSQKPPWKELAACNVALEAVAKFRPAGGHGRPSAGGGGREVP